MAVPTTLAEVLVLVEADTDLSLTRRRDLASALRSLGRIAHQELATIPASFVAVRALTKERNAIQLGLSAKRWANIKAELAAALRQAGIAPRRGRMAAQLPGPWRVLYQPLRDLAVRRGLSRFVGYCAEQGIAPAAVDDAVLVAFTVWLKAGTLVPDPGRLHRQACLAWNRAALLVPGWPLRHLVVPSRTNPVLLPPDTFPDSLHADVAAWQAGLAGDDLFAEGGPVKPLRPATRRHNRIQVYRMASACIRAGVDPSELRSLADLVEPARLKPGLQLLLKRHDGKTTLALSALVNTLFYLARHWVQLEPARLKELEAIRTRLHARTRGLSEKNRGRLRQFDDPLNLLRLLELPGLLRKLAEKEPRPAKAAYLVQTGLIVLLLLMAPMRISNLQRLHRERHLVRLPGRRRQGKVRLVIPGEETKNGEPLDFPLPEELVQLLDRYLKQHRPQLVHGTDAGWLFPGQGGGPKAIVSLSSQITATVRRHTGLVVHPHLFRHLAAKLSLQEAPGNYEQARRLLGHKSIDTTTLYYTGLDSARAVSVYQEQLLERHARLRGPGAHRG